MNKLILMFVVACFLAGCTTNTRVQLYQHKDNYYMVGGKDCAKWHQNENEENIITCYQLNGKETGYRAAMTPDDVRMYQRNKQIQNFNNQVNTQMQQIRSLNNQVNSIHQMYK